MEPVCYLASKRFAARLLRTKSCSRHAQPSTADLPAISDSVAAIQRDSNLFGDLQISRLAVPAAMSDAVFTITKEQLPYVVGVLTVAVSLLLMVLQSLSYEKKDGSDKAGSPDGKSGYGSDFPTPEQTAALIKGRRSIFPKVCGLYRDGCCHHSLSSTLTTAFTRSPLPPPRST